MYGVEFIYILKAHNVYGSLFSYKQYQVCRKCEDRAEFAAFWATTAYSSSPVYEEPTDTFQDYWLVQQRKGELAAIGAFFQAYWLSFLLLPLFPFWAIYWYCRAKITRSKIEELRARLTVDQEDRITSSSIST